MIIIITKIIIIINRTEEEVTVIEVGYDFDYNCQYQQYSSCTRVNMGLFKFYYTCA